MKQMGSQINPQKQSSSRGIDKKVYQLTHSYDAPGTHFSDK